MTDFKRFSCLQARAALAGYELLAAAMTPEEWLYALVGDAEVHELRELAQVERFLDRLDSSGMVLEGRDVP